MLELHSRSEGDHKRSEVSGKRQQTERKCQTAERGCKWHFPTVTTHIFINQVPPCRPNTAGIVFSCSREHGFLFAGSASCSGTRVCDYIVLGRFPSPGRRSGVDTEEWPEGTTSIPRAALCLVLCQQLAPLWDPSHHGWILRSARGKWWKWSGAEIPCVLWGVLCGEYSAR